MANPISSSITQGTVTKILSSVSESTLIRVTRDSIVWGTRRDTGSAEPSVSEIMSDGYMLFQKDIVKERLSFSLLSDFYIYSPSNDIIISVDSGQENGDVIRLLDTEGNAFNILQEDGWR